MQIQKLWNWLVLPVSIKYRQKTEKQYVCGFQRKSRHVSQMQNKDSMTSPPVKKGSGMPDMLLGSFVFVNNF